MTQEQNDQWKREQLRKAEKLSNRFNSTGMNAGGPTARSEAIRKINAAHHAQDRKLRGLY